MPEKLSIDINLDNVKNVETAKTYKAEHMVFDNQNQKLIDAFMKNSITEKKIWAVGPQFIASSGNTQEFLNIYDGGKSFGTETSVKRGGFSYIRVVNGVLDKLSTVADLSFSSSTTHQYLRHNSNNGYSSYTDLDFLPYKDALADIERVLKAAGIPQFDVHETYSLELEPIKSHYELYPKFLESFSNPEIDEEKNLSGQKTMNVIFFLSDN